MNVDQIMRASPVIPVLVLDGEEDWATLAETFVAAGLPVLEVTLRTAGALDAIRKMAAVPGAIVGAGTVLNERQLNDAVEAGAKFIVAPGLTEALTNAVERAAVPYLPGVATAADIMRGLDLGLDRFKLFPAEASGGIAALKALSGPFPDIRFCPTGGIRPDNAADWLALNTVLCVGGTWLYKSGDDMDGVAVRAREAAALRR
jgi:2-dehydro-3-deoxyphosphogluconate aldolase/(4S)-4-hydroxy-2-oxoglutarate aldolase